MADISVTIGQGETYQVTLGQGLLPHAASHAPGASDTIESHYYPRSNPSGYLSSGDFASQAYVTGVSGYLQGQIDGFSSSENVVYLTGNQNISGVKNFYSRPTVNGTGVLLSGEAGAVDTGYLTGYVSKAETGVYSTVFYPRDNPSGYITGVDLSNYATIPYVTGVSGYLQGQISTLNFQSGQGFSGYNDSITGVDIAGTSTKTITLYQRDGGTLSANFTDLQGTGIGTDYYLTGAAFNTGSLLLYVNNGTVISAVIDGRYALESNTGAFLTTGAGDSRYVSQSATGSYTGAFYPLSANPASYLVVADIAHLASTGYVTGASGYLQTQITSINNTTGNFITSSQTGQFYPINNPSGYITGVDLSNYATIPFVTGISGYHSGLIAALYAATGSYALSSNTGSFLTTGAGDARYYPLSTNPSSYLVAADLASYATTGYVTGVSGYLQNQISVLQSFTGQVSSGYNDSITGLSFSGTDIKTLYLYQRDGGIISGDFNDLQGTGGSASNVVYLTGDQNISGVKNFYERPTVNGTGVLLSGEASSSSNAISWNLVSTTVASNNATISINLTGYSRYMLDFNNVFLTVNGQELRLRASVNGGSSFLTGTSQYSYGFGYLNNYAPTAATTSYAVLLPLASAKPSGGIFGTVDFPTTGSSTLKPRCNWTLNHETWNAALPYIALYGGAAFVNVLSGINAIQLFTQGGNISGGILTLYGSNH